MPYATVQDAEDLYGEAYVLTSVDRDDDGDLDTTALTNALAQASSEIDSYLGVRYDVPINPVPDLLVRYTVDIALYQCSSGPGAGLTDEKRKRYEDAIRWLKDVAKGLAGLGLDETDETTEHLPQTSYNARLFTRGTMGGAL